MATFKELTVYYHHLEEAFKRTEETYYFNNDRSHNATVMRFMFDNAKQVNMYCGELSVLREKFYDHIGKDSGKENAEKVKDAMIDSLNAFFDRQDSKLTVVFESYSDKIFNDLICKDLFVSKLKENIISFYKLDEAFSFKADINHFCYTDSGITRFEVDKMLHNAICTFHNHTYSEACEKNFQILLKVAQNTSLN